MGKHKKSKRHREERPSSSRHRSDSSDSDSNRKHKSKPSKETNNEETNLLYFSFTDHKAELNRVLKGFSAKEQIVNDTDDFWLFVRKYENLLKKSGQVLLPESDLYRQSYSESSKIYDKSYNTNLILNTKFDELYARLSNSERSAGKINPLKLRQFLMMVIHYLDFKQKEKFNKLRKLRECQHNLPVYQYKNEIIESVKNERVVLIAGDTGCGKSTQVPQYLFEAGFQSIACTQPRRIACISLSKRVAYEMLCEYSTEVGYQIRFERSKSTKTRILFITEGLLLRQLASDEIINQYDVIVLDEVHERHLHGDFLLGITKCLIRARPELKLVLMSATINIKLFSDYFTQEEAKVIEVPGRLYPIKLHYMPQLRDVGIQTGQKKTEKVNPEPYIQIMQMIDNKYESSEKGDILIFMSGLNEITTIEEAAKEYAEKNNNWIILTLHSSLSITDQDKVFDYAPEGMRKCIISTNIAETSVTIDGIRFVIDSGKVKEMSYDPVSKMQRLKEFWISKASAEQRKGRAGRTGPGICYRLYSDKEYDEMLAYSAAEIQRVPLESLLLQMISMGLPNARLFPFIEPPPADSIETSIKCLKQHDALTIDERLTSLGKALSKIPVDISIGKMLLMGCIFQQLQPVLTMAAVLSVQSPFTNRAYRDHECERARRDLESDHGDPIILLNAYREWLELKQANFNRRNAENPKTWCRRRGLEEQRFFEVTKLRNQFQDLLTECGLIMKEDTTKMSSSERAIRNGELRQLRQLRREHKMEAPRKRKILKANEYGNDDVNDNGGKMDIRDIEFRISHDSSKLNNLVSGATACSYRDLMTLKLILVSGLYPQIAIADEFNYLKSVGQQFFHTQTKPFASLHPNGYFANNAQILQLTEDEILDKTGIYKSKLPLSSKHQLLVYLTLLETTKPYLMNTMRMPAAQTLLLFAHTIDTNLTFSKLVCDSWLCLDFPVPESGQTLLLKASNLRNLWNKLLETKLDSMDIKVEGETTSTKNKLETEELEYQLWHELSQFMNTEICYTLKRLLTADLKTLYIADINDLRTSIEELKPNPFSDSFEVTYNETKRGFYLTDVITYGCIKETDWSLSMIDDILAIDWECKYCSSTFNVTGLQKLQHLKICESSSKSQEKEKQSTAPVASGSETNRGKKLLCDICNREYNFTSIEMLKHKKICRPIKQERE